MYIKEINLINNHLQIIFYYYDENTMKSNAKSKISLILITIGILLAFSTIISKTLNQILVFARKVRNMAIVLI